MKGKLSALLRIFISFGLLALLFWLMRDEIGDIWQTIRHVDLRYIYLVIACILVNVTLLSWRLKIIFEGEDLVVGMKEATQLTFIGYFFNNFMPTAVGGDIVKAHYAAHANRQRLKSYASVLMDRFIGLYSFLIVAAIALAVDRGKFESPTIRPIVYSLLGLGLVGFVVATNTAVARFMERALMKIKLLQLGEKLHALYSIVHDYRNRRMVVVKGILMSVLAQSTYFVTMYLLFLSLGETVSIGNIFLIMPVVAFISMIPSVGGLGVREGAIVAFFTPLTGKETAFAGSLLLLMGLFFISLIGGCIYVWWGIRGIREDTAEGDEDM